MITWNLSQACKVGLTFKCQLIYSITSKDLKAENWKNGITAMLRQGNGETFNSGYHDSFF